MVVGACSGFIEPIDNRTCFARKSDVTITVELCQQSVYIDVSQTKHSIMQMKTTDYIPEEDTLLANCNRKFVTWPFFHQKNT